MSDNNIVTYRCKHRHSPLTHPKCYIEHLSGKSDTRRLPKVLIFDIETSPLKAFIWQKSVWKANVGEQQVISEWFMLTWSAKWLFGDKIMSDRLTGKEAADENDYRIVGSLWKLLDEADIVIAHNGDSFDVPNMNTRFVIHGYNPPSPYQTIDTLTIARRQFGFTHNNLNALARLFDLPVKLETDFELWKKCVAGEEKALAYMQEYNNGDVDTLEGVYMKLRPWIKGHPNLGLYVESDEPVCPNCGSDKIAILDGKFSYTSVGKYPLFRCECGAFGRVRKSVLDKEVSKNLLVGLSK
jgi:hypothetical protein